MTYLLDTNVVSELRKGQGRASPAVRARAGEQRTGELWLSVISVMEVEIGVGSGLSPTRCHTARASGLRNVVIDVSGVRQVRSCASASGHRP